MMKSTRRGILMEPPSSSPSSSSLPSIQGHQQQQQDARARFKHQALLQDYEELLRETETKKRQLCKTVEKKLRLAAEVKFLQRKFMSLRNPHQTTQIVAQKLKKKKKRKQPSTPRPLQDNCRRNNVSTVSVMFDLNQVSLPNADEMDGIQTEREWEPPTVDRSKKRVSVDDDAIANCDPAMAICRDVGNDSSHVGKRKISWQDQVALRV